MKSAHWGFSFTKSKINFLKQLFLYFNNYVNGIKKKIYLSKRRNSFCIFSKLKMSLPLIQINDKCEVPFCFVCICQKMLHYLCLIIFMLIYVKIMKKI